MSSRSGWSSSIFSSSRSMASARSLSSRTSGSHTIGSGLTTLALDALKLALDGAEIKEEGDHFVHLQSELGDKRYRKLCEDVDLALTEIHYCQEGLDIARINVRDHDQGKELVSQGQVEEMRQMKDLINHDYLVLKIQPGEPNAEALHIMAHKLRGGIHVTHIPSTDLASVFHEGVRCFTVNCYKGERKRIRLWAIIALLKVEDPDYSLRNANCWDYAKNTAKRLVKACTEVSSISAAEKARLQNEHDHLEANIASRHMHNIAKSLLRRISAGARNPSGLSNSSRALGSTHSLPRLSAPPTDPPASDLASVPNFARFLNFSPPAELSPRPSPPPSTLDPSGAANLSELLNSPALLGFSQPLSSPRALELSSSPALAASSPALAASSPALAPSSPALAPSPSSGKICLQILFLLLWLIISNLGLGPWAMDLLGGT